MIQRETSTADLRMHRRTDGPMRTCVGCRKRELAVGLLRVVAASTDSGECTAVVDTPGNLPGRGAWLHPTAQCLLAALRRRAFTKALRITVTPNTSAVAEHISSLGHPATEQVAKNMSTP